MFVINTYNFYTEVHYINLTAPKKLQKMKHDANLSHTHLSLVFNMMTCILNKKHYFQICPIINSSETLIKPIPTGYASEILFIIKNITSNKKNEEKIIENILYNFFSLPEIALLSFWAGEKIQITSIEITLVHIK